MKNVRGRKETFSSESLLLETLAGIGFGVSGVSRYLMLKLVEMEYVKVDEIKTDKRGRPRKVYSLSDKGQAFLISKRVVEDETV